MMRTTILVTGVLLLMLSASAAYAQKVESVLVDGYPVINCDGMPPKAYIIETKGNTEAVLKTADANKTVYKRFAVHKIDNSNSSNWSNAFTHCRSVNGGGWRLPTQRELQLMWVLKSALEKAGGFTPFDASIYWSATENTSYNGWVVYFSTGATVSYNGKDRDFRVRCVRELMPQAD